MDKQHAEQWLSDKIAEADKKVEFWTQRVEMLRIAMYGLTHPTSFEAHEAKELLTNLANAESVEHNTARTTAPFMSE